MKKKALAKDSEEFDRRFDEGEDIHNLVDMSKASVIHHGKKSASHSILPNPWSKRETKYGRE